MAAPKQEKSILVAYTLDFETGGLNCKTSACTQIAVHATRLDTFERIGTFVRYIAPYYKKEIKGVGEKRKVLKNKYDADKPQMMDYEDKALEYSAITMEMLECQGVEINQVAIDLLKFFEDTSPKVSKNMKPFIIGQNILFDEGFLCQLFEYAGLMKELPKYIRGHEDFYGHWHPLILDTITLGQLALCNQENISSYKLELMCENLGIELDDAHDADADVSATTNVVAVLTQRMRNSNGEGGVQIGMTKSEKTRKHFKI
ncbi:MAG: 3'-5' exonuclease [Bacteroidales bacterium]|nr:3'-5' exonuclease [Bacteroidales bacterium]